MTVCKHCEQPIRHMLGRWLHIGIMRADGPCPSPHTTTAEPKEETP